MGNQNPYQAFTLEKFYPEQLSLISNPKSLHLKPTIIQTHSSKIKTRKSASKRFKITSKGNFLRRNGGKQHLNEKKSRNRLNRLSKYTRVSKADVENVSKCLHYV